MKKANLMVYLLILSLGVLVIFMSWRMREMSSFIHDLKNQDQLGNISTELAKHIQFNATFKTTDFLSVGTVSDTGHRSLTMKELFPNGPRLCLRFTERNCESCFEAELKHLDTLSWIIGRDRILLLLSYAGRNALPVLKSRYGLVYDIYAVDASVMRQHAIEGLNAPYYFIADSITAGQFYVPSRAMPLFSSLYLGNAKKYLAGYASSSKAAYSDPSSPMFPDDPGKLGTVKPGEVKTTVISFRNPGTLAMGIQLVKPDCGCVEAEWPRYPIPAGDSAKLLLRYTASRSGKFQQQVTIFPKGNGTPVSLNVHGEVR